MELRKLNKGVLKLWYVHAAIISLVLIGVFVSARAILIATGANGDSTLAVLLAVGIPVVLLLGLVLSMPALRYSMYAWGYDEKRIVVKQGVIFRRRVVIPICQIQDLHRTQIIIPLSRQILSSRKMSSTCLCASL